jgi:hypothetical protein
LTKWLKTGKYEEQRKEHQESNDAIAKTHREILGSMVVCCWHINESESDGMWKLYLKDNEGGAISSTIRNLYKSLANTPQKIGSSKIRYIDYDKDKWYHPIDYPHINYNFYIPYFHKRSEFLHENEFRLYHLVEDAIDNNSFWNNQPNHRGMFIPVDIQLLINEIILHPTADNEVHEMTEKLINKHGFSFSVRRSRLQSQPIY